MILSKKTSLALCPFAVLLFVSLAIGCRKDFQPDNSGLSSNPKSSETRTQQLAFERIQSLLLPISNEQEFKDTLYAMVSKQFDEDWDVLLRDLTSIRFASSKLNNAMDSIEMELGSFMNIEGSNYYPHLFIPYFDDLQRGVLGIDNPAIVTYLDESDDQLGGDSTVVTAYQLGSGGDINRIDNVTGFYAREHEVWVVALNERVDDAGLLPPVTTKAFICEPDEVPASDPEPVIGLVINKIKVTEHKETWLSGASEVHISGLRTYYNGNYPGTGQQADLEMAFPHQWVKGALIKKISRSAINDGEEFTVNFELMNNWEVGSFYGDPILLAYTIFEYDPWPAGKKEATVTFCTSGAGQFYRLEYRSKDINYVKGRWMGNTNSGFCGPSIYPNYSVDVPGIQYNLCYENQ